MGAPLVGEEPFENLFISAGKVGEEAVQKYFSSTGKAGKLFLRMKDALSHPPRIQQSAQSVSEHPGRNRQPGKVL